MKIFVLIFLLLLANIATAEPTVTTSIKYYDIFPNSKDELGREMNVRSPIKQNGNKYIGFTEWYVKWNFWWSEKINSCEITDVITSLKVTHTMPRIPQSHKVGEKIRRSFEKYYDALLKHEKDHTKSGLYAAREIEKSLLNLGTFKSCEKLERVANSTGHKIINEFNQRDKDYDKDTDHGRTQGVDILNFM